MSSYRNIRKFNWTCSAIPRSDKKDGIIIGFYRGAEIEREREREREREIEREREGDR